MMPNIPPVWQMGGATRKGKGPEKIKKKCRPTTDRAANSRTILPLPSASGWTAIYPTGAGLASRTAASTSPIVGNLSPSFRATTCPFTYTVNSPWAPSTICTLTSGSFLSATAKLAA